MKHQEDVLLIANIVYHQQHMELDFLDIERVKRELQYFIDKKVRLVKFVDRTFNCNYKFSMAIWEFLINADTDTTIPF